MYTVNSLWIPHSHIRKPHLAGLATALYYMPHVTFDSYMHVHTCTCVYMWPVAIG